MVASNWCFFILTIIFYFLMSPNRIYGQESSTASSVDKEYHPDKDVYEFYPHQNKKAPKQWLMDTNKGEKDQLIRLEETEPGFDLTDEEISKFKIWPQGLIPYYIDEVSFDKVLRDRLRSFLDSTKALTGIRFFELPKPPLDSKTRWVFFINRRGVLECTDYTTNDFTNDGVQKILVGYDCFNGIGRLSSTVLGLVGVPPMHNAPNRDNYIEVFEDNITPDKRKQFKVLGNTDWLFHDIAYDFNSAGHYHYHQYTATGNMTIKPKKDINYEVGQKTTFSFIDAWKIRMLYNYISKKKGAKASVSECKKLFLPGEKIADYVPESDDELKPRAKPSKYSGIPEEIQKPPASTNVTKTYATQNDKQYEKTQEASEENGDGTKNSIDGKKDNDVNSKENSGEDGDNKENIAEDSDEILHANSSRAHDDSIKLKRHDKRKIVSKMKTTSSPFDEPDFNTDEARA